MLPRPTQNIEKTVALWHNIAFFCITVGCFLVFSSRWLFIGFYRAPGPYVKYWENSYNFVKYLFFFFIFKAFYDVWWVWKGGANVCKSTWVYATFLRHKRHTKTVQFMWILKTNRHFSHIAGILRCFIRFHWQCKRMHFYVVFAGTWILAEIT